MARTKGSTHREIYGRGPAGQPSFFCDACDCWPCQCHKPVYASLAEARAAVTPEPEPRDDGRHIPLGEAMQAAMSVYAGEQSVAEVLAQGPGGGA